MDILVLGPGCMNCQTLEKRVRTAVSELNIEADIYKITDITKIAEFGVMRTPALVIDNKVMFYGRVPTVTELKEIISKGAGK